jgi:conjugative relaxase-like TrwC/TraI family protein
VTVSMRVMSAGRGYDYLLKSVARGDRDMDGSTALTRYYTEEGTPPGRWLGSGLHALGGGEIRQGDEVTPQQLALLLGSGRDPVTGEPLGRAFPEYDGVKARVAARVAGLPRDLSDVQRREMAAEITREEVAAGTRRAVAGYDFTFSVPKSVSVLWGVAAAGTQALILEAHHQAMEEVLAFLEREVATTRRGVDAGDGAVAQADVVGIVATAYDHWDSRVGDPQLHTHVVISNKVKTAADGRWRSLDGRPLHAAVVALSAHYNAVLADRITDALGIEWEQRDRGKKHNPAWELEPVPETLIGEFSSRSRMIEEETDRLIEEYVARHEHRPSATRVIELRAKATLETRPDKVVRSLFDLTGEWRGRAQKILGQSPVEWARSVTARPVARPTLRADDIPLQVIAEVGVSVVGAVSEKRPTWRHWNLWAEASRQTMGWRFASVEDREAVVGMVVDAAEQESLRLTPPELAISPEVFRREDGSTVFRPRHSVVFTSAELLAAEDQLLARSEDRTAPAVGRDVIERVARRQHLLSAEQVETLAQIVVSGRQVDLLVGPAGAGKTTAMHALKTAWTTVHGKGSVVGLAPSAVAAQVLAADLGIGCENTAKWLHDHDHNRDADHDGGGAWFRSGQLVIIDEATLAGTLALDRITALAAAAGAKVLLVGDWAQLQSVEAGGAFTLLVSARPEVPELTEVHRFTHGWEKTASLDLRTGRTEIIGTYVQHERVREGTTEEMMDAAYAAWRDDVRSGRTTILVAEASETVQRLNARARAERIAGGGPAGSIEVRLGDGAGASIGDLVITRRNDRRLHPMRGGRCGGWVRNGDRWRVTHVYDDESMTVSRLGSSDAASNTDSVTLPAAYVAEHVDLGYAVTAHRAQGITVDTAHVVVSSATTRENFYVSMTRGSDANVAYVALDHPDEVHAPPEPDDVSARTVLYGVLKHSGVELSAHQTLVAEQDRWSSIAQLSAEYETIAAVAQRDRWVSLLDGCGLTEEQLASVLQSDSFGPLTAELRRAEANRHDVNQLLPALIAQRSLEDAHDVGAVLISRLRRAARLGRGRRPREPKYIVGLIPVAEGPMSPEMSTALAERQVLMEARAMALADEAFEADEPWLKRLGTPPPTDAAQSRWLDEVRTVAAYRDRYQVDTCGTLDEPRTDAQKRDAAHARQAIRRARAIADQENASRSGGRPNAHLPERTIS